MDANFPKEAGSNKKVTIFDSTLRDGAQGEGISYTLHDKLEIVRELDRLSVHYIEAGNPGSNPKDMEFFQAVKKLPLRYARLVAFGSTRRKDAAPEEDSNLSALLSAQTDVVSIFGKSSLLHVTQVLKTTPENNLAMIADTIRFLKAHGKKVFFDAEHFFDGYIESPEYALSCLKTAQEAGAEVLILCDTNGGTLPDEIYRITTEVLRVTGATLGIHCHNDNGCAAANTLMAVQAGVTQIQGTFIGFGERCGNTNLSTVIPSLQLKMGFSCLEPDCLPLITKGARFIAEISNVILDNSMPYVGASAFAHKGGMHVDGVRKNSRSFEHVSPESVGNKRNILVSEVAGRAAMLSVIREIDPSITKESDEAKELTDLLKDMESEGYLFESAGASLELLLRRHLHRFQPFFRVYRFKVIGEQNDSGKAGISTAVINVKVGDQHEVTAAEGEGPVHALDMALKKAVARFYPQIQRLRLTDYKVRVMEPSDATAASVRVMITTSNGRDIWTTVGVSRDIIEASLHALTDSLEYQLMKDAELKDND